MEQQIMETDHISNEEHEDRLSSLPEPIVVDILSFLPIHSAVTTSALSHRWRHLWTQTTNLNLDSADFINNAFAFIEIVDNILKQLTSSEIRKFKLHVRDPGADQYEAISYRSAYWHSFSSHLEPWIKKICIRNVKKIKVTADNYLTDEMVLPGCVFQCRFLVVLKLGQGFEFRLPDKIHLPCLKKLSVNLGDKHREVMQKLFRSCPLLEDLTLLGTFEENEHFVDISSNNLMRLNIQAWVLSTDRINVSIDAPNLRFFCLYDCVGVKFWFINEPSLSLELHLYGNVRPEGMSNTLELFQEIHSVKSIVLDFALIHALDCLDNPKLPVLSNLSNLTLSVYSKYLEVLLRLLHCSPNLEILTINMVPGVSEAEISESQILSDSVPACLLTHVKRMEIVLTEVEEIAMGLIKYMLSNATVMERVVVRVIGESEGEEVQLSKELRLYEDLCKIMTSSSLCYMEFHGIELQQEHHVDVCHKRGTEEISSCIFSSN